jgi:M6 family metalloprotease-like protein
MKKFLPIGLIALISFAAAAIPAKKGIRTFQQADGTKISLSLIGDENFHTYTTTDGLSVSEGDDGNFYYRTATGISTIVAHNAGERSVDELSFISNNSDNLSVEAVAKVQLAKPTARKAPKRGVRKASQVPSTGAPRIPILLVQYSDYKFKDTDPKATFNEFFCTGKVSAYQYFYDQSNGKYTPQFDVYGPITLSGTRKDYGGNDSNGDDVGIGKMVAEACQKLDSQINFKQYDNHSTNECDVVIVLYAGVGEASSYLKEAVWPCQWDLASSDYGSSLTLDNTLVNKFAVFNELNGSNSNKIDGIGTFCHEFSHCLDLPDFYDTKYGPHFGMGPWSLMDYGSYLNDGYTPCGYSAYEKAFMGWIDLEEGQENTFYELPVFNQKSADTDKAVKITNAKDKNEYYILENRANQGWDEYLFGEGMMITHVAYSEYSWNANTVNDYDTQRMTIIPADNSLALFRTSEGYYSFDETSLPGDLWPYGNATELTDSSTPAAKVYTGSYMSKPITEITKTDDGNITFWLMKAPLPTVAAPTALASEVNSSTSATISWEPGDDTNVTYTVEVDKHKEIEDYLVSSTNFVTDNTWAKSNDVTTSNNETYIASLDKPGSFTSPTFTISDKGVVTVIFNAKYYGNDYSTVKVALLDAFNTPTKTVSIELTADYKDYAVTLEGTAGTTAKVRILASKGNRTYLTTASVYNCDATSLIEKAPMRAAASTFTYTDLTDTSLTVTDLEEGMTYNYRVKAVPVDTDSYRESEWSETKQFTLTTTNGVATIAAEGEGEAEYFTLQGMRVVGAPTAPGIYIRRQGTATTKVLVK